MQSDTCGMEIPELDFELVAGTLGGRFTTVEGLLAAARDQLGGENSALMGDSTDNDQKTNIQHFVETLNKVRLVEA